MSIKYKIIKKKKKYDRLKNKNYFNNLVNSNIIKKEKNKKNINWKIIFLVIISIIIMISLKYYFNL
jgi:hypothetical protein